MPRVCGVLLNGVSSHIPLLVIAHKLRVYNYQREKYL